MITVLTRVKCYKQIMYYSSKKQPLEDVTMMECGSGKKIRKK